MVSYATTMSYLSAIAEGFRLYVPAGHKSKGDLGADPGLMLRHSPGRSIAVDKTDAHGECTSLWARHSGLTGNNSTTVM